MAYLFNYIDNLNRNNKKALSAFLTFGFPNKEKFLNYAEEILENGADILEIGIPFSDPIADGPIIQYSSQEALKNNYSMNELFETAAYLREKYNKPIILMGYINPILKYSIPKFTEKFTEAKLDGCIIPDVPFEELSIFSKNDLDRLKLILLSTPMTKESRIREIDKLSNGFVYSVSIAGVTGNNTVFSEETIDKLKKSYSIIKDNKMLVGFGISSSENINKIKNYCDGVIVGSAIIKTIMNNQSPAELIKELSKACGVD